MNDHSSTRTRLIHLGPMAVRAKVPAKWLRSEAEDGKIPCLRAGHRLLFDPDVVLAVLEARARQKKEADA